MTGRPKKKPEYNPELQFNNFLQELRDAYKELNAKRIATEPVRLDDYTGKKMTFFHDPDGLPLEIHE